MFHREAFDQFREGVARLRDHQAGASLDHFRRAVELVPGNAYYRSYLGVAMARVEGKWADAERLCFEALHLDRRQAQLYLNLAEVYTLAGRKDDACDVIGRGLRYQPSDYRLRLALSHLATRRPPPIRFLPRTHFINRNLGRLRHRALQVFASL